MSEKTQLESSRTSSVLDSEDQKEKKKVKERKMHRLKKVHLINKNKNKIPVIFVDSTCPTYQLTLLLYIPCHIICKK